MAEIKGKVWNFGDNIDTDVIIPGRYLRTFNPKDLAEHVLEGERADFTKNVKQGDLILAGEDFWAIKYLFECYSTWYYSCISWLRLAW